jgi:glucose/arabinose dehydrogenase
VNRRVRLTVGAAALVTAVLAAGCGGGADSSTSTGTTPGTRPVIAGPGTLPPPVAVASLDTAPALKITQIADMHEPVAMTSRSGTNTLYVAQKDGRIKQIGVDKQTDKDGKVTKINYRPDNSPLLDISRSTTDDGERGLLGIAFSSDGRKLYVDYTDRKGAVTVDEYLMNDDSVDTRSRRTLLSLEHPENNHNGGQIAFGPDGFLYIGVGDGGGQGDPNKNGQNTATLYGKILRIDPEGRTKDVPYSSPAGNPFRDGQAGAPEVWAYGLRNPWRFSWDKLTKDLWIADVGQDTYEEIDLVPFTQGGAGRGANFGWSELEGKHPYNDGKKPADAVDPIFEYDHSAGGCSVVGGFVYRGKAMFATLSGTYLYADYCTGEIRLLLRLPDGTIDERGTGITLPKGQLESNGSVTSFAEDTDGEFYVMSALGGIYKIEPV